MSGKCIHGRYRHLGERCEFCEVEDLETKLRQLERRNQLLAEKLDKACRGEPAEGIPLDVVVHCAVALLAVLRSERDSRWTFEEVCQAIDTCESGHAPPDNRVPCDFRSLHQVLEANRAALSTKGDAR